MSRAEYMREYRAKKAAEFRATTSPEEFVKVVGTTVDDLEWAHRRIGELEEEVQRLKRALAQANRDAILRGVNRR